MITGRRLAGVAGTVALVIALAACSSSSNKSSTSSTSASSASGAPVTVGVICDCTGDFGTNIAPVADVARAWADTVNAAGGVDGHLIKLTVDDDGSVPGTSITDAQKLISSHVDVILDDSNYDAVWASAVSAAKIPVVGGNFSTAAYYTNPDFFPSGQTNDSISYSDVAVAKLAGASKLADMYCAEAAQCAQSAPLIAAAGKSLGVPVVYKASISMTSPNYTAQCVAAEQAGASAIFIGDSSSVIARVAEDCSQQNYHPTFVTEGTGFGMVLASSSGLTNSLWSDYPDIPFWDTSSPAVQAMDTAVDKVDSSLRSNGTAWTEYSLQTWTAGLLIEDAVKASDIGAKGTPTAATVLRGLDSIKGDTLDGMSPPLTFSSSAHKVDCWYVGRIQNGKPVLANNGQLSCEKGSSSS